MKRFGSREVGALALVLCAALASCGGSGASGGGAAAPRPAANRLTATELERAGASDVYGAVQELRPQWLVVRGGVDLRGQQATIAVIMDGVQQSGGIDVLRNIPVTDVQEVSFLSARDATTKYGTNMTAGAIVVVTKH
jgi:outer membrane receptor protein involved in Fe transport